MTGFNTTALTLKAVIPRSVLVLGTDCVQCVLEASTLNQVIGEFHFNVICMAYRI